MRYHHSVLEPVYYHWRRKAPSVRRGMRATRRISSSHAATTSYRAATMMSSRGDSAMKRFISGSSNSTTTTTSSNSNTDDVVAIASPAPTYYESKGDYQQDAEMLEDPRLPLYAQQAKLPILPVPTLEETIETFLPTALPLARTNDEATSLQSACHDFLIEAKPLQQRLLQWQQKVSSSSWVQEWWNTQGYLNVRSSNVVHVSYFFREVAVTTKEEQQPQDDAAAHDATNEFPSSGVARLERASAILHGTVSYAQRILDGTKPPDEIISVGRGSTRSDRHRRPTIPLCSSQFKYLFACCRIPGKLQDTYRIYGGGRGGQQRQPHCAIVAIQGQFYSIPLTEPPPAAKIGSDGRPLPLPAYQIQQMLQACCKDASKTKAGRTPELGWLTTQDRDAWYRDYQYLRQSSVKMEKALEELQKGLIMICLNGDDSSGKKSCQQGNKDQTFAKQLWHGNGSPNRWYDKSIQLVLDSAGSRLGLVGEHSLADGMPNMEYFQHIQWLQYQGLSNENASSPNDSVGNSYFESVPIFEHAFASLTLQQQQEIETRVDKAKHNFLKTIDMYDLQLLQFETYGSDFMKQAGLSPDAFTQMAMQVASARYFNGETVGTYESSQTRVFLHGRTETLRTVSPFSKAFCQAMMEHRHENDGFTVLGLLREACDAHSIYAREKAAEGKGCDRHFFGLQNCLREQEKIPTLFSHPLFIRSKKWRLSTSNVPDSAPGFGPVVPDGFGIGYHIHKNHIVFTITAKKEHNDVERMKTEIAESLKDMSKLVVDHAGRPATSKL